MSRKFAVLLLVGLLSILGVATKFVLMSAKSSGNKTGGRDSTNAILHDQRTAYTSLRAAETAIADAGTTLDDASLVSEVQIG